MPPLPHSLLQRLGVLATDSRARRASVHMGVTLPRFSASAACSPTEPEPPAQHEHYFTNPAWRAESCADQV